MIELFLLKKTRTGYSIYMLVCFYASNTKLTLKLSLRIKWKHLFTLYIYTYIKVSIKPCFKFFYSFLNGTL